MSKPVRKIIAPEASRENRSSVLTEGQPDKTLDETSAAHRRALARLDARKSLVSVADQVAGDTFYFRRYRWPQCHEFYPDDMDGLMRFVSRYYPHAEGGPLYVDEPKNQNEAMRCEEKRKAFKKLRLRYTVINREYMTTDGFRVEPARLMDALEQLE